MHDPPFRAGRVKNLLFPLQTTATSAMKNDIMKLPLTSRIVLLFTCLAAVLLVTVGLLSYRSASKSLKAAALSEMLTAAVEKDAALDTWFEERLSDIAQIAGPADVAEKAASLIAAAPGSPAARSAHAVLLEELDPHLAGPGPHFTELFVMEPEGGKVVASTSPAEEGKSKLDYPYFRNGKTNLCLQPPYLSVDLDALAMTAAIPLRAADGRVVAVLAARLDLAAMTAIVQRRTGLRQTEDAFLINAERVPITQPHFIREPVVLRRQLDTEAIRRCAAHNSGVVLTADYRGVPSIAVYRWNAKRQLGLIVKVDQSEALAPARAFGQLLVLISSLALLATVGLALRLARTITRPLRSLHDGVKRFAEGKLREPSLETSGDEVGLLAHEFNQMAAHVVEHTAKLAQANDTLRAENAERKQTEAALQQERNLLRTLIDHIPDYIYVRDLSNRFVVANESFARLMGVAGPSALIGKRDADFYPPSTAADYDKIDQEVFAGCPHFNRECVLLFPNGQELVTLNTKVPFKNDLGEVMGLIGVGRDITERKLTAAAMVEASGLIEALLQNTTDAIYFKDLQSRFVHFSAEMLRLFHLTRPEELKGRTDFDFFSEEHARPAFETEQEIIRTGKPVLNLEEKETYRDGRTAWVSSSKMPWRDGACNVIGTMGISRCITRQKEAQAELENLHKKLVDASRQAGMAEIATNVLHNVGNVLNSVNVSTGLVIEGVRKSRASNLARVVALLQDHAADLGAFITHDPKGQHVPAYLAQLSEHLQAEQEANVRELELLRRNVEHIKEIVAMQQNYATYAGVNEIVNVVDLVEDSLRINEGALSRHEVEVIREFENVLPVTLDKHKFLQILVNLLRNAKYACDDAKRPDKRLTVRVANGEGQVKISVIDNGIGIPADNLTRIFSHGFTTRKGGHGFGLHSGALAAKEMGGSLTVHSDGPGLGAAFTLTLPCPSPEKSHA